LTKTHAKSPAERGPSPKGVLRATRSKKAVAAALSNRNRGGAKIYSPKVATKLCDLLTCGLSIAHACSYPGMPSVRTAREWVATYPDFAEAYGSAVRARAEYWAAELIELGDELARCEQIIDPATGRTTIDTLSRFE
jgi:hypothetical protein